MKTRDHSNCSETNCVAGKPQHTPTPWHIDYGSQPNQLDIINEADDKQVCLSLHGDDPEDKANLELIVRAVNAHEELLGLLKQFAERIEDCEDCDATGKEGPEDACGRCGGQGKVLENGTGLISDLDQAIANAEGR